MITYSINNSTKNEILNHLVSCNNDFIPSLSSRVDINDFSNKMYKNSIRFEAWDNTLVGLVGAYLNSPTKIGFITNMSIIYSYQNLGIAKHLLLDCIDYAKTNDFIKIRLEVNPNNQKAIKLYKVHNFVVYDTCGLFYKMEILL